MSVARHLHLLGATGAMRTALFENEEHLVVPVVALVEGVIHAVNAATPELVLASEFSIAPAGWNGRPVVYDHPNDGTTQISANIPHVLETMALGRVFNTEVKGKRLLMDAYLNPARAKVLGATAEQIIARVRANEMIEVSVGVFVVAEKSSGTAANGATYDYIWRNIVPDHLALLPAGMIGACSIEMGCGTPRAATVHVVTETGLLEFKQPGDVLNPRDEGGRWTPGQTLRDVVVEMWSQRCGQP